MGDNSGKVRLMNSLMAIWPTKCLLLVVYSFDTQTGGTVLASSLVRTIEAYIERCECSQLLERRHSSPYNPAALSGIPSDILGLLYDGSQPLHFRPSCF